MATGHEYDGHGHTRTLETDNFIKGRTWGHGDVIL